MTAAPSASPETSRPPDGERLAALVGLAAGLACLIMAATLLQATPHWTINLLVAVIGIALTWAGLDLFLAAQPWRRLKRAAGWLGLRPAQLPLIVMGVALSLGARSAAGDGAQAHLPIHGWLWAAGIASVVAGSWIWGDERRRPRRPVIAVAGTVVLLALSLAVRAVGLDTIPAILGGDEGGLGLIGAQFASGERNNLLAMGWFSWPALHAWLVSVSQSLLGPTIPAIRWPSAIAGTLTVLATLWMARALFGTRVGWLSALAVSASHVHLLFSRVALNNVFDGLLLAVAVGGLWIGWERNKRWAFLTAGMAVGLSPYFYATGRLLPLVLAAWAVCLHRRTRWQDRTPGSACAALTAGVTALPLSLFYFAHLDEWIAPLGRVSVFNSLWLQANGLGTSPTIGLVAREFSTTLLGFVASPVQGVYVPELPYLDPVSATLFLGGLALALLRIRRPQYAIVPIVLLATALAGAFSLGAPSAQRLVFAAPIVAVCVALPVDAAIKWARARNFRLGRAVSGLALLAFLAGCLYQVRFFFVQAMPQARYSDLQGLIATEVGRFLQRYPAGTQVYFISPGPMGFYTIPSLAYLAPNVRGQDFDWRSSPPPQPASSGVPTIWVTFPSQPGVLPELEAAYPRGRTRHWVDTAGNTLFSLREVLGPGLTPGSSNLAD